MVMGRATEENNFTALLFKHSVHNFPLVQVCGLWQQAPTVGVLETVYLLRRLGYLELRLEGDLVLVF